MEAEMATQRVPALQFPSQPAPQVIPQPEPVTQQILAFILATRQQIVELEKELSEAQAGVQDALQAGAEVEPGMFRAALKVTERRSVAWKQVCERQCGADYCARVLAATKPDTYTHL